MRDDNSQQQFEQHQEQEFHEEYAEVRTAWWEKNNEILRAFDELRPIITGEKDYKGRNLLQ